MADNPLLHPDKDELVAFGLGKLQPDQATKIETHLEECKTCCDTLLDLEDDTFVELVRKSPAPKQSTDEANTVNTMPVESGVSRGPTELPAQLDDHPRYRIIELIGKGGMGDVYKAEHRLMHRPVALKLINQDLVKNKQAVERFRREVRAAARLTHPNIVTAHDAEQAGDVHFLVMEFVNGVDLASEVQNRGSLPIAEACDYIRQAAEGLQHAHTKGMVHRDIKPHNLMLSADGQVRILDFGLASFATESALIGADAKDITEEMPTRLHLTTLGSVMGTPDYIAPEQARDAHSADIRADIYSLGCTLCYLLTGEAPFAADSVVDKLKAHAEHEPPALQGLREDAPAELADVVTRMMAKNPDERFQTPAEVATALSQFVDVQQSGSITPQRSKRNKLLAIATTLLVPLLLVAGVVIYLATDTGQIEIDATGLNLPNTKLVLLKNGEEYARFSLKADENSQTIRAGEYEVQLQNATSDVKMEVWSKGRSTNHWGDPADHRNNPIVLYRGGGLLVRVSRRPPPQAGLAAPGPTPTKSGILTSPPSVPPDGLPVGRNLIVDPSLEDTPTGSLPQGWFAWLDDGPEFKCEVFEGGVTGKHCLQISGTGTRGVVFATSIPMDRTKRYALKGKVKVEGDAGTWAVIKLNYFNRSGWLGIDDRVGVTSDESDWQFFEKTDRANAFPEATLIVPTCHIEGNGTAWFDDLEVVAYDRDKLPEDFDKQHGKNNRMYSLE